ncbi:fos-related antigen 1-like isoform X1 [Arapaima gigas]
MEKIHPSGGTPGARNSGASLHPTTFPVFRSPHVLPSLGRSASSPYRGWVVRPDLLAEIGASWSSQELSASPSPATMWQKDRKVNAGTTIGRARKLCEEQMSVEEMEKKKVRRERNRIAAARCRSRRQELLEKLQNETDKLEHEKAKLQEEIAELEKEKSKLELVLEIHLPICKIHKLSSSGSAKTSKLFAPVNLKINSTDKDLCGPLSSTSNDDPSENSKQSVTAPPPVGTCTVPFLIPKFESLHTPVFISTPSLTPLSFSMVFSYPSSPFDSKATDHFHRPSPWSSSSIDVSPQDCGAAYRRGSSSGDQYSDHSLNSPTLLAL